jgi:hypothetical protein
MTRLVIYADGVCKGSWVTAVGLFSPFVDINANDSRIAERTCVDLSCKRKIAFDPFADSGVASSLSFADKLMEAKSDNRGQTGRK